MASFSSLNRDLICEMAKYMQVDDLLNLIHTEKRHRAILAECITEISSNELRILPAYLIIKLFPKLKRTTNIILNFTNPPADTIVGRLWSALAPAKYQERDKDSEMAVIKFLKENTSANADLTFTKKSPEWFSGIILSLNQGIFRLIDQLDPLMGLIFDHNRKKYTLQISSVKNAIHRQFFGSGGPIDPKYFLDLAEKGYLIWNPKYETSAKNEDAAGISQLQSLSPAFIQFVLDDMLNKYSDLITSFVIPLGNDRKLIKISPDYVIKYNTELADQYPDIFYDMVNNYNMMVNDLIEDNDKLNMTNIYDFLNVQLTGAPSAEEIEELKQFLIS